MALALPQNYGTNTTLDTLASSQQNIAQFGEDRAWDAIDRALQAHNTILATMMSDFCETTTDRLRRFGNPQRMKFVEVDEMGNSDAQKITAGVTVGFPLRLYELGLQWSKKYMQNATGAEMAAQMTAAMDADTQNNIVGVKKALFNPTNYLDEDRLVDHLSAIQLPIKALANADGAGLPVGPNGEVFDGTTHNHYLVCATPGTLTVADGQAVTRTVLEHFDTGNARLYIAQGDENAWRALAGFVAYFDARITQPITAAQAAGVPLNVVSIYNRAIGIFNGAEVWVKPWMVQGYAFAWVSGQAVPLCRRIRSAETDAMVLEADNETHPLRAKQFSREVGYGVYNRVNGAMLDMTHNVYTAPVITG